MSTDKTLADVQPGGRVRLGDQLPPLPKAGYVTGGDFGHEAHNAFTPEQMRDYALAALSAQPSPGGQGEVLSLAEHITDHLCHNEYDIGGRPELLACVVEALAARQPVGATVKDSLTVGRGQAIGKPVDDTMRTIAYEAIDRFLRSHMLDAEYETYVEHLEALYAAPPAQAVDLGTGVQAIACERERQLRVEGFSPACDAHYIEGELARAATAYAQLAAMDLQVGTRSHIASHEPPFFWPWAPEWWKPVDARRDLVRAGALIAAQIDLIDSQAVGNG